MNTEEYKTKTSSSVTVAYVKGLSQEGRKAVITGAGEWREYDVKDSVEKDRKPVLPIEVGGEAREWTLNATTNERLGAEFGTFDTEKWVGGVVKLLIDKQGDTEYITATVIQPPTVASHE